MSLEVVHGMRSLIATGGATGTPRDVRLVAIRPISENIQFIA